MTHELLVALDVSDPALYEEYRAAMRPLLEAAGGGFRGDFEIARTLKNPAAHAVTRLFLIHFPDRAAREAFYADPEYRRIKARFFGPSVRARTILAEYVR